MKREHEKLSRDKNNKKNRRKQRETEKNLNSLKRSTEINSQIRERSKEMIDLDPKNSSNVIPAGYADAYGSWSMD